jgi:hypothetical protein
MPRGRDPPHECRRAVALPLSRRLWHCFLVSGWLCLELEQWQSSIRTFKSVHVATVFDDFCFLACPQGIMLLRLLYR